MKGKISIKEIASMAQVSPATVSRVINRNGRYSKETEQRVRDLIDQYEYEPNQLARGLRKNRNRIVGVLVPDITNEYFAKMIQVIQTRLFDYDYPVTIYNTNESRKMESKCLRYLRAQNVSGVIYINGYENLEGDSLKDIPTIYIDRFYGSDSRDKTVYVSSDNEMGGYIATKELIDRGCRRIAVMIERYGTYVMNERLKGCMRALDEHRMEFVPSLVFAPEAITYNAAYAAIEKELKKGTRFDGIFCQTDWLASGTLAALQNNGVNVPEDVKLVGFDNISISFLCEKPFSTVMQDIEKIGHYTADTLINLMRGMERKESTKVFPVELIRRKTT